METEVLQNFHFLRPAWLLGLIALPLIWFLVRQPQNGSNDWQKAIAPELLAHLTPGEQGRSVVVRQWSLLAALLLGLVALAGPSWEEKPQPVVSIQDNMVVILDLSLSMLATDNEPDRLTKTKQKLSDLLKLRREGTTGLIVFSGDAHVVTPLTDDTKTILANLPALEPFMMPVIGSRPDLAIEEALMLLDQGNALQGRIVMLTDGVRADQVDRINDMLAGRDIPLNIIASGTRSGAPIQLPQRGYLKQDGNVVIPKTDFEALSELAGSNQGEMVQMTLDDSDLTRLDIAGDQLANDRAQNSESGIDKRFDSWHDMGYFLLIPIIPLVLLAYRQGALLVLLLAVMLPVEKSHAVEWEAFWKTPDQRGQELLEQDKPEAAAEVFESLPHKAAALYKAGKYEAAAALYEQIGEDNIDALYNQANALAHNQKYEEALAAYENVLEQQPDHEDARHNKRLIEQLLEQQKQQQQDQQSQQNQDQDQDQNNNDNRDNQQSSDGQSNEEQNEDQQAQDGSKQDQDQRNPDQQSSQDQSQQDSQNQQQNNQASDQQERDQQQPEEQTQQQAESSSEQESEEQAAARQNQTDSSDEKPEDSERAQAARAQAEQLSDEEQQSYEQWMRRVPDDPGGLLRRKFEQQARERQRSTAEEGDPLW